MKRAPTSSHRRHLMRSLALAVAIAPAAAHAYVGPGAGLTAIGTMLALVAAVLLAVVGFVWYPLKRLMGKGDSDKRSGAEPAVEKAGGE